jgi:hypothetical protein
MGGYSQKYAIARPHVPIIWPIQHGVKLIQKKISSLEKIGFLFDFEHKTNLRSLFKGEPSTSNNF